MGINTATAMQLVELLQALPRSGGMRHSLDDTERKPKASIEIVSAGIAASIGILDWKLKRRKLQLYFPEPKVKTLALLGLFSVIRSFQAAKRWSAPRPMYNLFQISVRSRGCTGAIAVSSMCIASAAIASSMAYVASHIRGPGRVEPA